MTTSTCRRAIYTRELLANLPQDAGLRQAFSAFMNSFQRGKPFECTPLPGASDYERIEIRADLHAAVRRRGNDVLFLQAGSPGVIETWARTNRCEVNPATGFVQIYQVPERPADEAGPSATGKLFEAIPDEELLGIGLPHELLALLRAADTVSDFEKLKENLPESVYEVLTWFTQGESWSSIREAFAEAFGDKGGQPQTAVGRIDSERFHLVENDEEMRAILEKPLAQWRVFLHPLQRKVVDNPWKGAVLVTGGAGTGKTVAALHRVRHLVRLPDWKPGDRLLLTTFTKNLAMDLEEQLRQICSREEMKPVQVQNIDAWLAAFIRQRGADKTIAYPGKKDGLFEKCWEAAWGSFTPPAGLDRPESFYRREWEEVVLPLHCRESRDYLFADRRGRGTALTRLQRRAIWPLFEDMRLQLELRDAMTVEDAAAFAVEELQKSHPGGLFRAVVADEIQDFRPDMLRLLRALAVDVRKLEQPLEGDLFLVGDPRQRIYGRPVSFASCGIDIRGRSRKLRLNYRTTDEIRRTADAVNAGKPVDDLNGGVEEPAGYSALRSGPKPETHAAKSPDEAADWICQTIRTLCQGCVSQEICVAARTNDLAARYGEALETRGLRVRAISRSRPDDPQMEGVRVATMHRIKGLEFKVVFVVISDPPPESDEARETALLYVAASRAADRLFFVTTDGSALPPGVPRAVVQD